MHILMHILAPSMLDNAGSAARVYLVAFDQRRVALRCC